VLGTIVGVSGVRGEVKIRPSRIGEDTLRAGLEVRLQFNDARPQQSMRIARVRRHKAQVIAALAEIGGVEDAQRAVGATVAIERDDVRLAPNEYFDEDLVGCELVQDGRRVGVVAAVRHYPAQDVLELEGGALVPMVGAFIRGIDVGARVVDVELPPGLVEGEPEKG